MNSTRMVKIFVMILSLAAGLSSQTSQGTISGTVADKTGAVVPGATVTIVDASRGFSRAIKTNGAGQYSVPNLEPGTYSVTTQAPNFQKLEKNGVTLDVGKSQRVDFLLVPGDITQTVAVTEQAPIVDTSSAVLSSTFDNAEIVNLPLQGRDFQNVISLTPGVERSPGGGFMSISSNGNRFEDNNYIVDGIDDNDAYYGETVINSEGVQGTPATHLPIDAIQEFSVQQSPEAEYGWKPGAVVNLGIKSGTNLFHGSLYYFNRNSAYDARNYFNPAPQPTSALNLNEYGASLGGPIVKDKLFFFANYEGVQDKVGNPIQLNTPVTVPIGDPSSSIPDAIAYCQDPTHGCPLNAIGLQMAKLYPNNPGGAGSDPTLIPFDFNNTNSENNGIAKVDYHFSDHHNFSVRYFQGRSIQTEEDVNVLNPAWLSQADTHAQVFGVTWAWTPKSNLSNQVRFGYNNFWQQLFSADHNVPPSAYGLNTGITTPLNYGLTQVRVSGFNSLGGNSSWPLLTVPNKTYQISDTVAWTLGKHSLRLGGEFRTGSTNNTRDTYGKGRVDFRATNVPCDADPENGCDLTSLESLVSGNYNNGRVFEGGSQRNVSQKSFGFFAQDNWRMTPRLTVIAGLRWDASLPITANNNLLGNFTPANGLQQVGQQISQPYNGDWNNFAPRLGFAYDVFGDGRTVLRAGAGIIYEIPHISLYISQNNADALGLATIPTGAIGDNGQKLTPNGTIAGSTVILNTLDFSGAGPIFGNISPTSVSCTTDNPCSILGSPEKHSHTLCDQLEPQHPTCVHQYHVPASRLRRQQRNQTLQPARHQPERLR